MVHPGDILVTFGNILQDIMVHLQFGIFQGSDVQNLTPSDDFCESKMILVAASFLKGLTEGNSPKKVGTWNWNNTKSVYCKRFWGLGWRFVLIFIDIDSMFNSEANLNFRTCRHFVFFCSGMMFYWIFGHDPSPDGFCTANLGKKNSYRIDPVG